MALGQTGKGQGVGVYAAKALLDSLHEETTSTTGNTSSLDAALGGTASADEYLLSQTGSTPQQTLIQNQVNENGGYALATGGARTSEAPSYIDLSQASFTHHLVTEARAAHTRVAEDIAPKVFMYIDTAREFTSYDSLEPGRNRIEGLDSRAVAGISVRANYFVGQKQVRGSNTPNSHELMLAS